MLYPQPTPSLYSILPKRLEQNLLSMEPYITKPYRVWKAQATMKNGEVFRCVDFMETPTDPGPRSTSISTLFAEDIIEILPSPMICPPEIIAPFEKDIYDFKGALCFDVVFSDGSIFSYSLSSFRNYFRLPQGKRYEDIVKLLNRNPYEKVRFQGPKSEDRRDCFFKFSE
ncbi:MAG: hypothetical protein JNK65_06785 [Deltaproteobacteria bacterium]|nr:hypothetical protein [Deltaproteobacteria bacterium]